MTLAESLLRMSNVSKAFGGVQAVSDFSMDVKRGEILGLIGPNGAGKTTVFNLISGVQRPSAGSIWFAGAEIGGLRSDKICRLGIARTFQTASFLPDLTVRENIGLAATFRESTKRRKRSAGDVVAEALSKTGLSEVAEHPAEEINVSQQKRLEIARAIATEPVMMMTDEIVAGLNPAETDALLECIIRLNREGMTIVFVEHDVRAVLKVSHRLVVLSRGALLAEGDPHIVARLPEVVRVYLGNRYVANR